MNLSSIIVLAVVIICFIYAVKNIKKNSCGCGSGCSSCNKKECCNKINITKDK